MQKATRSESARAQGAPQPGAWLSSLQGRAYHVKGLGSQGAEVWRRQPEKLPAVLRNRRGERATQRLGKPHVALPAFRKEEADTNEAISYTAANAQ
ncbi:hypothetical protein TREES_T100008368 [Tupaia chinensis]|uniref:Uncharacterized protein n=1 Tax=Tupaia chinensis TaxID=246437 RepID=L9LBH2_TUPCH|nr:hypothetical protein TREES_T100008368 [Tupaia chinensis]